VKNQIRQVPIAASRSTERQQEEKNEPNMFLLSGKGIEVQWSATSCDKSQDELNVIKLFHSVNW
jgi:hypothetical protein